jgi:hypothetical protein
MDPEFSNRKAAYNLGEHKIKACERELRPRAAKEFKHFLAWTNNHNLIRATEGR